MKENEPSEVDGIPSKMLNETIETLEHINIPLAYVLTARGDSSLGRKEASNIIPLFLKGRYAYIFHTHIFVHSYFMTIKCCTHYINTSLHSFKISLCVYMQATTYSTLLNRAQICICLH